MQIKIFVSVLLVINCGPVTLINGQVEKSNGTTFGSVATFSCNAGYMSVSHQQVVVCGADGMWSPASPSCNGNWEEPYPLLPIYSFSSTQLLTVVLLLLLLMGKWTSQVEPPLRVQLPTPVTLATHCLVQL